jgi:hypothetical protein
MGIKDNYLLVDLCKCKYCGSYVISLNDVAQCPRGCSGNMRIMQSTLFQKENNKIKLVSNHIPNDEYENMRKEIT